MWDLEVKVEEEEEEEVEVEVEVEIEIEEVEVSVMNLKWVCSPLCQAVRLFIVHLVVLPLLSFKWIMR